VNHGRLRLILGTIRIIFGMGYSYPDFTQIIDYGVFWRNLVQMPTTWKSWVSCRSSRSQVKVKHNKNILTD